MSLKDWPLRAGLLAGAAIGVGAAVVAPAVFRIARPGLKTALKAGFAGMASAQVAVMKAGEHLEDLLAEVAHEMAHEEPGPAAEAAHAAAAGAAAASAVMAGAAGAPAAEAASPEPTKAEA
ncbi:hypothetical protein [Phenylobacterium sp.]|uniref:hypothetical protein n=1 Tax=Phenylobacterium sp. TaxID=1871053 RepID=UPI0035AF6B6A